MIYIIILCLFPFLNCFASDDLVLKQEMIPLGSDFKCHSSSLVEVAPDQLCGIWKSKPGLWCSRCEKGVWTGPELIVEVSDSCWTPVLCKSPSGELLLFYRAGPHPWHVISLLKRSADGGKSWSQPEILPAGIPGPVKSKPIFDAQGNMICGGSIESGAPEDDLKATSCWIQVSPDCGVHWSMFGPIEIPGHRFGAIEPAIFRDKQGNLRMICRDRAHKIGLKGWLWTAKSLDGGQTWSPLEPTSLPSPDASIDIADLGNGKILLFYNHSHTSRFPLNIAISQDGGDSWMTVDVLEMEQAESPSAMVDSAGLVHITYAVPSPNSPNLGIKYVVLDPANLPIN